MGSYYGVALGDYNGDGYLDALVANVEGSNALYRNTGSGNSWVQLKLEGVVSNYAAIGARVYLYQSSGETVIRKMRELASNSGYSSLNDLRVHFGLGENTSIDSIEIHWPEAHVQKIYSPTANQTLEVAEVIPDAYLQSHFSISGVQITGEEISFTSNSKYDDSYEVSFAWDFNDDGVVDSEEESPMYVYTEPGVFDVSLEISNSEGISTFSRFLDIELSQAPLGLGLEASSIKVYPNPSESRHITIESEETIEHVVIWGMSGNKLFESGKVDRKELKVSLNYSGVVFVETLLQSGVKETHKAVIGIK